MDKVEKKEIVLTVNNANTIQINGKKPTKSFISQIPLEEPENHKMAYAIGWINLVIDNKTTLDEWRQIHRKYTWSYEKKLIPLLYINLNGELRRMYITQKELNEDEEPIRQIYI